MAKLTPREAHERLESCGVSMIYSFHALSSDTIDRLLAWADTDKYRKPKNANGSRARYYHDYLQRVAARKSS